MFQDPSKIWNKRRGFKTMTLLKAENVTKNFGGLTAISI